MAIKMPKKYWLTAYGKGDFLIWRRKSGKKTGSYHEAVGFLSDVKAKKSPKGSFIKKGKIVKRRVK